ncbi:hypothetical protein [Thalassotalea agarivorans]|uniref:Lipoprotein n=1 Tax=Thalassotalea agarivorans TaxID=349064 RepID=A0A1I0HD47_THASX|nr:hypothetical protein [Thalassotalea agarivorans]SET81732.1 hypothetical protein SAMN05660429_02774 [Thalassotalea agarivorans]
MRLERTALVKKWSLIALFCLFSIACSDKQNNSQKYLDTPICIDSQSQCTISLFNVNYAVAFNVEKLTPEQPFVLSISGEEKSKFSTLTAYIEGETMFMGKIPLFFSYDNNSQSWQAEGLFGSCSEPIMVWRIVLEAKDSEGNIESTSFTFESRNR